MRAWREGRSTRQLFTLHQILTATHTQAALDRGIAAEFSKSATEPNDFRRNFPETETRLVKRLP